MKKSILVIIISLIAFTLSIQIVNDLKTKPYIEFDWIKNKIYAITITFGYQIFQIINVVYIMKQDFVLLKNVMLKIMN